MDDGLLVLGWAKRLVPGGGGLLCVRAVCFAPESVSSSERNDRIAKIQSRCRGRDAIQSEDSPNNATSGQRVRTGQRLWQSERWQERSEEARRGAR